MIQIEFLQAVSLEGELLVCSDHLPVMGQWLTTVDALDTSGPNISHFREASY